MRAVSMAAATVSPMRARTSLPSTVRVSVAPVSPSRWNMEPPRAERSDHRLVERAARDHRRDSERMVGAERDAGMAAQHEGAGVGLGLVVDREAVFGHDANGAPGTNHISVGQP